MAKKVNLEVLNKLVTALQEQITIAEALSETTHNADRTVELSKAIGIASAISSEALFLVGDIANLSKQAPPAATGLGDDLLSFFGPKKKVS